MDKIQSLKKPGLIFFVLFIGILLPPAAFPQAFEEDAYLTKAFATLKENPPPEPTDLQKRLIAQLKEEIERSAARKKFYQPSPELADRIGFAGFPSLAELLRSPDPWTRALAARALYLADRPRSLPFLIGQLSDKGRFDYMDDVAEYTVAAQADGFLASATQGAKDFTAPVRELADPSAKRKSAQNYYSFHLPFCQWTNKVCFLDTRRMFTELETTRFGKTVGDDGYEGIHYVYLGNSSGGNRFPVGTPINIILGFTHFGNRMRKIRWDVRDTGIHKFRLIAPNDAELKLKTEGLPVLDKQYPVVQGQWRQSSLGKDLDLAAMYDIDQRGVYRFYYEYMPPKVREEDEQSRPVRLWHWNGRDYVNYYEFMVE